MADSLKNLHYLILCGKIEEAEAMCARLRIAEAEACLDS